MHILPISWSETIPSPSTSRNRCCRPNSKSSSSSLTYDVSSACELFLVDPFAFLLRVALSPTENKRRCLLQIIIVNLINSVFELVFALVTGCVFILPLSTMFASLPKIHHGRPLLSVVFCLSILFILSMVVILASLLLSLRSSNESSIAIRAPPIPTTPNLTPIHTTPTRTRTVRSCDLLLRVASTTSCYSPYVRRRTSDVPLVARHDHDRIL